MHRKRFGLGFFAVLSCAFALMMATASAYAQPPTKVRYGETIRSLMFTPSYIAFSRGYFKDAGLDVHMTTLHGTDKTMTALLTNSVDIALLGPEAVIYLANSQSPVKPKIISGLTATDGFLLMSRNTAITPQNFKWSDLKGKSLMAYRAGSTPDVFIKTLLHRHGLVPGKNIKIIDNVGPAARMSAWLAGQGDFGIFSEPRASTIERMGKGKVVVSDGQQVGQVDYTVFAARPKYIKAHPQVIHAWASAIARGMHDAATDNLDTLADDVAKFFPGLSHTELVQSLKRYRHYGIWKKTPYVAQSAIKQLQDMLIARGILKTSDRVAYDRVVAKSMSEWKP